MDTEITIKNLKVSCIIGDLPHERIKKQAISIDIEFYFNLGKVVKTDKLKDSVDYYSLAKEVISFTEKSKYNLIEVLASKIADLVLKKYEVGKVLVRVKKPSAIKGAEYVSAEVIGEKI